VGGMRVRAVFWVLSKVSVVGVAEVVVGVSILKGERRLNETDYISTIVSGFNKKICVKRMSTVSNHHELNVDAIWGSERRESAAIRFEVNGAHVTESGLGQSG
jgi:hypothetical protein